MKLFEEFKLYEDMWDDDSTEALNEKIRQPKPFSTTTRSFVKGPFAIATVVAAILTGSLAPFATGGIGLLVGDVITDVIEAVKFNKTVKKYDKVKQLITKSYSLRRNIFKLIDKVGTERAAEILENLDNYITEHPELLDIDQKKADIDITFGALKNESLMENIDNINMSMEDFLRALADMRKEYGDDHLADVDEINAFVADWKAENEETPEV